MALLMDFPDFTRHNVWMKGLAFSCITKTVSQNAASKLRSTKKKFNGESRFHAICSRYELAME
jgi:hypothetical protein